MRVGDEHQGLSLGLASQGRNYTIARERDWSLRGLPYERTDMALLGFPLLQRAAPLYRVERERAARSEVIVRVGFLSLTSLGVPPPGVGPGARLDFLRGIERRVAEKAYQRSAPGANSFSKVPFSR
jgi:hypothetical protein